MIAIPWCEEEACEDDIKERSAKGYVLRFLPPFLIFVMSFFSFHFPFHSCLFFPSPSILEHLIIHAIDPDTNVISPLLLFNPLIVPNRKMNVHPQLARNLSVSPSTNLVGPRSFPGRQNASDAVRTRRGGPCSGDRIKIGELGRA